MEVQKMNKFLNWIKQPIEISRGKALFVTATLLSSAIMAFSSAREILDDFKIKKIQEEKEPRKQGK